MLRLVVRAGNEETLACLTIRPAMTLMKLDLKPHLFGIVIWFDHRWSMCLNRRYYVKVM